MLPVEIDGARMFLLGMRETPAEPMRYLRVPVDRDDSMGDFVRLRGALADPALRDAGGGALRQLGGRGRARCVVRSAAGLGLPGAGSFRWRRTDRHAGNADMPAQPAKGGLPAVSAFLEVNVPAAERERASDVLVRILNGTLFELMQIARERAGLAPLPRDEATQTFMTQHRAQSERRVLLPGASHV